jgi:hypothetical protein
MGQVARRLPTSLSQSGLSVTSVRKSSLPPGAKLIYATPYSTPAFELPFCQITLTGKECATALAAGRSCIQDVLPSECNTCSSCERKCGCGTILYIGFDFVDSHVSHIGESSWDEVLRAATDASRIGTSGHGMFSEAGSDSIPFARSGDCAAACAGGGSAPLSGSTPVSASPGSEPDTRPVAPGRGGTWSQPPVSNPPSQQPGPGGTWSQPPVSNPPSQQPGQGGTWSQPPVSNPPSQQQGGFSAPAVYPPSQPGIPYPGSQPGIPYPPAQPYSVPWGNPPPNPYAPSSPPTPQQPASGTNWPPQGSVSAPAAPGSPLFSQPPSQWNWPSQPNQPGPGQAVPWPPNVSPFSPSTRPGGYPPSSGPGGYPSQVQPWPFAQPPSPPAPTSFPQPGGPSGPRPRVEPASSVQSSPYFPQCDPTLQRADKIGFTICMFRSDIGLNKIPRVQKADVGNSRLHFIGKASLSTVNLHNLGQFRAAVSSTPSADYAWAIYGRLVIGSAGLYNMCITSDDG